MKKMIGAGNDDDREILWPRPIHNGGEWNGVVLFAVNYECIGLHCGNIEAPRGRRDQYHLADGELGRHLRLDETTEGKSGEKNR